MIYFAEHRHGSHSNSWPTHPGEMLFEEFLKPLRISQTELAQRIGVSYPRINELIHGKRGVTPDTALRLERLFGIEAQFWLNLQLAWDLYHAIHSPAAAEIQKIERRPTAMPEPS
jgi:antitoxin HigA-1